MATVENPSEIKPEAAGPYSQSYVRYALWMLLIIYTLNFVDRQIVGILAEDIKRDLGVTDSQMGLLGGLAFALFYTVLGIPIARYAERGNRARIISTAVAVWSGFTAISGAANSFMMLLLARIGVGVGEAGCTPPAHSLISDYVAPAKRASALAFYSLGVPIGTMAGFAIGAIIAQQFGWRIAFFAVGIPGVLLAVVAWFTLKEPRVSGLIATVSKADSPSFGAALKELSGIPSYWYAVGAATVISFLGYGHAYWLGGFLARVHDMSLQDRGIALALMTGVGGGIGTWLGGQIADWAVKRDTRAYMSVPAIAFVCGIPFFVAAMFAPNAYAAVALLAIPTLMNGIWYGPVYAAVQSLVHPRTRATAVAIMLFVVNLIGLGAGPTVVGLLSDFFANQNYATSMAGASFAVDCAKGAALAASDQCKVSLGEGLRYSLLATASVGVLALLCFIMGRLTIREDLAKAAIKNA